MNIRKLFLSLFALLAASAVSAQTVVDLWPEGAPSSNGDKQDRAELYVYLPDKKINTGRAVVACPGGGYQHLAMDHEGKDWAYFFNHQGIALIVLKYRMPHGNYRVPLDDAEAAMRTVRLNAKIWHIDPSQVGIMGFSAGGHLASTVATHSKGDAKADFQILFYPVITMEPSFCHRGSMENLLGKSPKKKLIKDLSNDLQVSRFTPRAFIALSEDDQVVQPANGANYYLECYRHDVPASIHVYPKGGHGWGYREAFPYHMELLLELKAWLRSF